MELQKNILEEVKKDKKLVEIILLNGFHIKGVIEGYDKYSISLKDDNGKQQMLLKHVISTIKL